MRCVLRVRVIPHILSLRRRIVAAAVRHGAPRTAGVLPFRLRRQPILHALLLAQPAAKLHFDRYLARERHNRKAMASPFLRGGCGAKAVLVWNAMNRTVFIASDSDETLDCGRAWNRINLKSIGLWFTL